MKKKICRTVDDYALELIALSHAIHDNPELSGEEFQASRLQIELYKKYGFSVEENYGGLKTSFKASKRGQTGGPIVAFLAEYDALPGLGHGCGHNIIAASAAGAALALAGIIEKLSGEICVIGCPSEEAGAGKIKLLNAGAFDRIDFVMETHPSNKNMVGRGNVACADISVEYYGKPAHSSMPGAGINALSALISLFNQIDVLRQTWNTYWVPRINGIINAGGVASNVIPDYAKGTFLLRAEHEKHVKRMLEDVRRAAKLCGELIGAETKMEVFDIYAEMIPNRTMGARYAQNMESLGEKVIKPLQSERKGSSDVGNVSQKIPTIHEYVQILYTGDISHTIPFRDAAVSKRGDEAVLIAAKTMAMTAYDLFTDSQFRLDVRHEFEEAIKSIDAEP